MGWGVGKVLAFEVKKDLILIIIAEEGPQIVVPNTVKQRMLYANHYYKLAGYPGVEGYMTAYDVTTIE